MPIPNKARGRTVNTRPTKTDQAGARETDLNIIVSRFLTTGTVPGHAGTPLNGDFTNLPRDYRDMIHQARSIERLRGQLPKELANLTISDLVEMSDDALVGYLKPKETPEQAKEQQK